MSVTVVDAQRAFAAFLQTNPASSIEEVETPRGKRAHIKNPWGDPSLSIPLSDDTLNNLPAALNNIYLPERYTGVWHTDTKEFEIIFTAYPLPQSMVDLKTRAFEYTYKQKTYLCGFRRSSDRVLAIAKYSRPAGESATSHRNLPSFFNYTRHEEAKAAGKPLPTTPVGEPISFWIKDIEWNEENVLNLINNLSFYMSYYDTMFPTILIHSPQSETIINQPQTRYIVGKFPSIIKSRDIDDNLLHFWHASRIGDPARRFLYSYRIVEYAAFNFLEAEIRESIKKILASPHALDEVSSISEQVVTEVQKSKLNDTQKFDAIFKEVVRPKILWAEMSANMQAFLTETRFEGGFSIAPIAKVGWAEDDFKISGLMAFSKAVREIRNALSHGRDQRTSAVIAPTPKNFQLIQPWTCAMAVAASEILIYKDVQ